MGLSCIERVAKRRGLEGGSYSQEEKRRLLVVSQALVLRSGSPHETLIRILQVTLAGPEPRTSYS